VNTNPNPLTAWIAVVISLFAIAMSGFSLYLQYESNKVEKAQLGAVDLEAHLKIFDGEKDGEEGDSWGENLDKKVVSETDLIKKSLFGILKVSNPGGSAIALSEVGVYLSPDTSHSAEALCISKDNNSLIDCEFPLKIDSLQTVSLYISMSKFINSEFQCNNYIEQNGIIIYARTMGNQDYKTSTNSSVGAASYCPDFIKSR
jgi:hypothetical protein